MDETSTTTTLKETLNMATTKELDATENLGADESIFYHSLRNELDLLKKNPSLQTIHHILNYSKSLR
jgi:hypothetical protein